MSESNASESKHRNAEDSPPGTERSQEYTPEEQMTIGQNELSKNREHMKAELDAMGFEEGDYLNISGRDGDILMGKLKGLTFKIVRTGGGSEYKTLERRPHRGPGGAREQESVAVPIHYSLDLRGFGNEDKNDPTLGEELWKKYYPLARKFGMDEYDEQREAQVKDILQDYNNPEEYHVGHEKVGEVSGEVLRERVTKHDVRLNKNISESATNARKMQAKIDQIRSKLL